MAGLIWVIQVLHYPAFADIGEDRFTDFHAKHSSRITFIVLPVMLIELVTALMLVYNHPSYFFIVNLLTIIGLWAATATLSVPIHSMLSEKQDVEKINRLVGTNWIRTFLWSFRLVFLAAYFFYQQGAYVNLSY